MTASDLEVRRARPHEGDELSTALGAAFRDDPIYRWMVPDAQRRHRRLATFMRILALTAYRSTGPTDVAVTGGQVVGAAIWVEPDHLDPGAAALARALPGMLRSVGPRGVRCYLSLGRAVASIRPSEPHRYLFHVGSDPAWQGHGVGSALVSSRLTDSDADGVPTHLECEPDVIGYYERFGFAVTERVPVDALELWGMVRAPVSPAAT